MNTPHENFYIKIVYRNIVYKNESKVLQYFSNVRYNLAALDVLVEVVKVMNHIGLWDAEVKGY